MILRDRWHGADKDYGLKLTNRTGTIDIGNQILLEHLPIPTTHPIQF